MDASPERSCGIEPHLRGIDPRALIDAHAHELEADRAANSALRSQYRTLRTAEREATVRVKDAGAAFMLILDTYCQPGRETSLARRKVEEAVMWAVKGITE